MITRGMNIKDIVREYEIDELELLKQHNRINQDNRYRRYIMKNLKSDCTYIFKPVHFKSSRGNDYLQLVVTKGYNQYKKYGLEIHNFMYYRIDNSGYYVVSQTDFHNILLSNDYGYTFYPPHFFNRYQERYVKEDKPRLDLIVDYFKANYVMSVMKSHNNQEKYPGGFYCYGPHGITLGSLSEQLSRECDKVILFSNTFVTLDMLKGDQVEKIKELQKVYIESNSVEKDNIPDIEIEFDPEIMIETME